MEEPSPVRKDLKQVDSVIFPMNEGPLSKIFLKEDKVVTEMLMALARYLASKNLKPYQFLKKVVDYEPGRGLVTFRDQKFKDSSVS